MQFCRVQAILLRQVYLVRGSFARLLPLFVWVAVDMVLWGFLTRYLNSVAAPGFNFVPLLLGAVLLWDYFARVMQGVTMAFFEDVWSRNFLNFFASPLTVSEYLSGLVLTSIATSIVGLVVMLFLATAVFGLSFFAYGLALIPFLLELFLFGIALGILGCTIVLRFGPSAEWFIWPIPGMLSPFAGVFYPLATLPKWMQYVGRLLPPSYVFEGMRKILLGGQASHPALLWGAVLSILWVLLAAWCFKRTYRHALKTGLIARFTAETLT